MLKFIVFLIIFLFTGCAPRYYSFDSYQKSQLVNDHLNIVSEKEMCNMISKDTNSWIEDKQKCLHEITNYDVDKLISFKYRCNHLNGIIKIEDNNTYCKLGDKYFIPYDKESFKNFDIMSQTQDAVKTEAKKFNTIKELCLQFQSSVYNEKNRNCEFINNTGVSYEQLESDKYTYSIAEKIVREKDNQAYDNERIEKNNIRIWENEAKNWKGSLEDLCENLTDSKSNFDKNTLDCKTYWKKEIKKYEVMKPFLVEQHQKIMEERNKVLLQKAKEEREKEIQIKNEWENRIGKSQEIINVKGFILDDRSFVCESYKSYWFFFPKRIRLDAGLKTIRINDSMLFKYIDSFKDYYLYQAYTNDNKIINLKIYKDTLLKTTPYSLDIEGLGYYCDLLPK